jgi:hypothetical protein
MKYPLCVGAKVTEAQAEALRELARREERLPSDIIRRWLDREAKRQRLDQETPPDDLPPAA